MSKIAIVIITHNRPQKIISLLSDIEIYTTDEDFKVYILDNGTNTNTTLLRNAKERFNQYNWYHSPKNLWPGQARNLLFSHLQNEDYVVTLDDDIRLTSNWLQGLFYVIEKGYDAAGCRIIQEARNVIHSQGGIYTQDQEFVIFKEHLRLKQIYTSAPLLECTWLPSGCSMYKREIIDKFKYDDSIPNMEDPIHGYLITKAGYKLASTDKSVVFHTKGPTANIKMRSIENIKYSVTQIYSKYHINVIKSWNMDKTLFKGRRNNVFLMNWVRSQLGLEIEHPTMIHTKHETKNVDISIVVPFKNEYEALPIAIQSIQQQNNFSGKIETIVVNLGGRSVASVIGNSSREIHVKNFSGKFNRAFACNVGAKYAAHDFLFFLDPTCLLKPDFFHVLFTNDFLNDRNITISFASVDIPQDVTYQIVKNHKIWTSFLQEFSFLKPSFEGRGLIVNRISFISKRGFDESFFGSFFEVNEYLRRASREIDVEKFKREVEKQHLFLYHLYSKKEIDKEVLSRNSRIMSIRNKSNQIKANINRSWGDINYPPVFTKQYKTSEAYR